ncbi:MAG: PaaI family thioesterase [Clostridia bacterium]|nr:PaaI family thioesterase [Clostridia bacterium]
MKRFATAREAREYFDNDRFAATNGVLLDEITEDGCVCHVDLNDTHRTALGGVMGGIIFTLADFAFAVSSNNVHEGTVALDVSMQFLSAAKGSRLIARSFCVKEGRSICVYRVEVSDETGRKIALFTGTGFKP